MAVIGLLQHCHQSKIGLRVFLADVQLGGGIFAGVFYFADTEQGGVANLTALQKAFKVDAQLAAFEDIGAVRERPAAGGHPGEGGIFQPRSHLRFYQDVKFFKHGLGVRCQFRIIGEQVNRQIIVSPGGQ